MKVPKSFIGKEVKIEWANPIFDWHYFMVIDKKTTVKVQGITDKEDGSLHDGTTVWVRESEIKRISLA